jgi:hypothetical protein
MTSILSNIQVGEGGQSFGGVGGLMTISGASISVDQYRIFAMTSLTLTSIFAAILVSVIQKGNAKEAVKRAPMYVAISLANYLIASTILRVFLGGFFPG